MSFSILDVLPQLPSSNESLKLLLEFETLVGQVHIVVIKSTVFVYVFLYTWLLKDSS